MQELYYKINELKDREVARAQLDASNQNGLLAKISARMANTGDITEKGSEGVRRLSTTASSMLRRLSGADRTAMYSGSDTASEIEDPDTQFRG